MEDGLAAETSKKSGKFIDHVKAALEQWETFSHPTKAEVWKLEILRYCAKQSEDNYQLERKLERTQDFVEELRAELARLRESNVRSVDAARLPVGPVVHSDAARELEKIWATGALADSGGWTVGAGRSRFLPSCIPD